MRGIKLRQQQHLNRSSSGRVSPAGEKAYAQVFECFSICNHSSAATTRNCRLNTRKRSKRQACHRRKGSAARTKTQERQRCGDRCRDCAQRIARNNDFLTCPMDMSKIADGRGMQGTWLLMSRDCFAVLASARIANRHQRRTGALAGHLRRRHRSLLHPLQHMTFPRAHCLFPETFF